MTTSKETRILHALFCLSRDTLPIDAGSLGRVTGLSAVQAAQALVELERTGLVDASRARLTMLGLARAVAVDSSCGGHGLDLSQVRVAPRPRSVPVAAQPVAAQRDEDADAKPQLGAHLERTTNGL